MFQHLCRSLLLTVSLIKILYIDHSFFLSSFLQYPVAHLHQQALLHIFPEQRRNHSDRGVTQSVIKFDCPPHSSCLPSKISCFCFLAFTIESIVLKIAHQLPSHAVSLHRVRDKNKMQVRDTCQTPPSSETITCRRFFPFPAPP